MRVESPASFSGGPGLGPRRAPGWARPRPRSRTASPRARAGAGLGRAFEDRVAALASCHGRSRGWGMARAHEQWHVSPYPESGEEWGSSPGRRRERPPSGSTHSGGKMGGSRLFFLSLGAASPPYLSWESVLPRPLRAPFRWRLPSGRSTSQTLGIRGFPIPGPGGRLPDLLCPSPLKARTGGEDEGKRVRSP